MKTAWSTLALLAAATIASAQGRGPTGVQVRVGYGFSPSFDAGNDSKSIQGFDVGVALPLGTFLHSDVLLEPSFFGGDNADVYRLTAFLHRTFAKGVGARIGVGYSNSTRNGDIDGRSGVIVDFGVEIPFDFRLLQKVRPYADIHGIVSDQERLSGVFFGVGVRI